MDTYVAMCTHTLNIIVSFLSSQSNTANGLSCAPLHTQVAILESVNCKLYPPLHGNTVRFSSRESY